VAPLQLTAIAGERLLQAGGQRLHRALEVPEPERLLHHRQHRGAVESGGAIGGLLGVEPQLQIEKPPQPRAALTAGAAAEPQQIGHAGRGEQATRQVGGAQGREQLAQIPEGTGRQHRIPRREGPVGPVDRVAEAPEAAAAREALQPLAAPGLRITVDPHRLAAVAQMHHAAGIERRGRGRLQPEPGKQTGMDSARLKAGHLGGAHIEGPGAAAEGAGTAAALMVGLEQQHPHPFAGQEGCRGETRDAGPHHHHIALTAFRHRGMLAAAGPGWMG